MNILYKMDDYINRRVRLAAGLATGPGVGAVAGIALFSFTDLGQGSIERTFKEDAPDWRAAGEGLNLEGKCKNQHK